MQDCILGNGQHTLRLNFGYRLCILTIAKTENLRIADPNLHRVDKLLNNRAGCYQSLLLAKAFPEWDFRYFSNDSALALSLKAR